MSNCELCGEPMPEGETMFKYHGYSGNCPMPPLPKTVKPTYEELEATITAVRAEAEALREDAKKWRQEHPRSPHEKRDEIEMFLRDAYAAGCRASWERSLFTALEYARREAPRLRAAIDAARKVERNEKEW